MRLDCRVFAIAPEQWDELKSSPALVLGRLLLAGRAICDLPDSRSAVRLILSDPDDHRAHRLVKGGEILEDSSHISARLFSVAEVQELCRALLLLDERELARRFNHQALVSSVLERISSEIGETPDVSDFADIAFPESEEDFVDVWTLEQADAFEHISEQVERLQNFIAEAARRGQCVVVVIREAE